MKYYIDLSVLGFWIAMFILLCLGNSIARWIIIISVVSNVLTYINIMFDHEIERYMIRKQQELSKQNKEDE